MSKIKELISDYSLIIKLKRTPRVIIATYKLSVILHLKVIDKAKNEKTNVTPDSSNLNKLYRLQKLRS